MSHKILRPFIVKISVLCYFPLLLESLLITAPPTNSTLITGHYHIFHYFIININTLKVIRKITIFFTIFSRHKLFHIFHTNLNITLPYVTYFTP